MRSFLLTAFFACIFICYTHAPTLAQDTSAQAQRGPLETKDTSGMATDDQIKEAEAVFQHCKEKRVLNSQFDCKCFSSRFLEERRKVGPLIKWDSIFLRFRNDCRNVEETTNMEYSSCMAHFGIKDAINMEPKEYCECYAKEWAELFENYPGKLTFNAKGSLKSQARGHCQDLDRAK